MQSNFGSKQNLGVLDICWEYTSRIIIDFGAKKKSKNHIFGLMDSGHQSIDGGLPQ